MEQTLHTTDFTAAELMVFRGKLITRLLARITDWMAALEDMAAPTTAVEITRHCRAASALMTLLNKLVPVRKAAAAKAADSGGDELAGLVAQVVAAADKIEAAPVLNRHQRRKLKAMRRSG